MQPGEAAQRPGQEAAAGAVQGGVWCPEAAPQAGRPGAGLGEEEGPRGQAAEEAGGAGKGLRRERVALVQLWGQEEEERGEEQEGGERPSGTPVT